MTDVIVLRDKLIFATAGIDRVVLKMWRLLYKQMSLTTFAVDRAIWTLDFSAGVIMTRYGGPNDNDLDPDWIPPDPIFVRVTGLDKVETKTEEDWEILDLRFRNWIEPSIIRAWNNRSVKTLHEQSVVANRRFGVYSCNFDTADLTQMKWLVGDKLRKPTVSKYRMKSANTKRRVVKKKRSRP